MFWTPVELTVLVLAQKQVLRLKAERRNATDVTSTPTGPFSAARKVPAVLLLLLVVVVVMLLLVLVLVLVLALV